MRGTRKQQIRRHGVLERTLLYEHTGNQRQTKEYELTTKNSPPAGETLLPRPHGAARPLPARPFCSRVRCKPIGNACRASLGRRRHDNADGDLLLPCERGPIYTYLNTVFNNFEKSHPGIIIKREDIPNSPEYLTTIADEASAGALPDVLMLDNPMVPTIASYNVLTPLSSLGKTAIPTLGAAQQAEAKFNGTIYGYPLYTNTIALFYNKAILSAANIAPPTTWAQLLTDAKALTNSQHYGIAFAGENCSGCNVWTFIPFLLTNGGSLTDLTSPQSVQALTLWTDLVKEGAVDKDVTNWNQGQPEAAFAAGKAAMMINGPWNFGTLNSVKGLNYGVVQIPVNTPGQAVVGPIGGEVWTIPRAHHRDREGCLRAAQLHGPTFGRRRSRHQHRRHPDSPGRRPDLGQDGQPALPALRGRAQARLRAHQHSWRALPAG